ncbi:MAG: hypothetical protein LV477_00910 [Candidatus Nitrosotalea sp.]|nr:hypothetical protein [Candidatus Nitrosotalea sp.]
MSQEKKIPIEDHEYDDYEWGHKEDSEKTEWEEYFRSKNRKWIDDSDDEHGQDQFVLQSEWN